MADDVGEMRNAADYVIPFEPPPDALAELDAAAVALDQLTARALRLTIDMDEQSRAPRIELEGGSAPRRLTPTQLFELLTG